MAKLRNALGISLGKTRFGYEKLKHLQEKHVLATKALRFLREHAFGLCKLEKSWGKSVGYPNLEILKEKHVLATKTF